MAGKGSIDNFSGPKNELLSDVIGGVTNNTVGGYPIPTGAQSNEFPAEYFSYCITGSQNQLTNVNRVFENSTQFADEMLEEMVK